MPGPPLGPWSVRKQHASEYPITEEDLFSPSNKLLANISFTSSSLTITEALRDWNIALVSQPKIHIIYNLFRWMQLVCSWSWDSNEFHLTLSDLLCFSLSRLSETTRCICILHKTA